MKYQRMSAGERILKEFPGLSREDLDAVDALYEPYLFYEKEKNGRQVWTTCCHHHEHVSPLAELVTPEDRLLLAVQHGDEMLCPWCGRPLKVKNRKLMRSAWKHKVYIPVLILHTSTDGATVYAQGYWTMRDHLADPLGKTLYMVTRVYRYRRGEVLVWERDQWDGGVSPVSRKGVRVPEPFQEPYHVIGMNRLADSFLKYTGYDQPITQWEGIHWNNEHLRTDLANYLAAAARYPENVEMLRKAGMNDLVRDLVYRGKKNAAVLKWGEKDPRAAFGLTRTELKEFLATKRSVTALYIHKSLRKAGMKMSFADVELLEGRLGLKLVEDVLKRARNHGVPVRKLLRYLESFTGPRCHGGGVAHDFVAKVWCDYIDAAEQLGYDMSNPIHQMPRELDRRHDEATAAVRVKVEGELMAQAKERFERLQKKYAFEDEEFFIRAPYDAEEIIVEGKALKHCVGGYAERHAKGATTILFLRRKEWPAVPYVTIEMDGNEIRQIHGYRNDLEKGAVSPMVTHKKLLHDWRAWLKAGSRRDKKGNPVMPKEKKKEATVA